MSGGGSIDESFRPRYQPACLLRPNHVLVLVQKGISRGAKVTTTVVPVLYEYSLAHIQDRRTNMQHGGIRGNGVIMDGLFLSLCLSFRINFSLCLRPRSVQHHISPFTGLR